MRAACAQISFKSIGSNFKRRRRVVARPKPVFAAFWGCDDGPPVARQRAKDDIGDIFMRVRRFMVAARTLPRRATDKFHQLGRRRTRLARLARHWQMQVKE
jgi:hypothetical protein